MFRQNWNYDPTLQSTEEALDHFLDVLETIKKLISEGKIRHFGLSNESAWGVATWIKLSEKYNLPRVVSIQNEYSLLCRLFDTDLAELSHHENVGLLAFSPLAAGLLSGKYQNGVIPEGSRMSIVPNLGVRVSENAFNAINCYIAVARKFNIDPCQMALAFCRSRGFVSSAIIGATKKAQLKNALESTALKLNDEILQEIYSKRKEDKTQIIDKNDFYLLYEISNIKKILPKRLFYRALLIVAVPVITIQLIITIVFFDSLWIKTNKGMTRTLVN